MSDTYKTKSTEQACYLVALGANLPRAELQANQSVEFTFDDPDGWAEWAAGELTVRDLDGNQVAMVSAPKLFSAMRKIRTLLYQARGEIRRK